MGFHSLEEPGSNRLGRRQSPCTILGDHSILTVSTCTFSGNSASANGGGIFNNAVFGSATLSVSNCTFSGNSAGGDSGGDDGADEWARRGRRYGPPDSSRPGFYLRGRTPWRPRDAHR